MFKASGNYDHYVSFGTTDQQTLLAQRTEYDGLLVPGTVAAFQKQGTGGFVLSMSAANPGKPYVIDPRTPLFQQALPEAKKSHTYLAEELGDKSLVSDTVPDPLGFHQDRVDGIARAWLEFNGAFRTAATEKFAKYARRLQEDVAVHEAAPPLLTLAPYFMAKSVSDPWWNLSKRLFSACRASATDTSVVPVVASTSADWLTPLVHDLAQEDVVIWVSDLHELNADEHDLLSYAKSIQDLSQSGHRIFALYGGFFAVLLASVGLMGASHGIGYGEHRSWIELPRSGPPPARYYVPALHRYVAQDVAERLGRSEPRLAECDCEVCEGRSPLLLEYHDLMRHSVIVRQREVEAWASLDLDGVSAALEEEYKTARAYLTTAVGNDSNLSREASHLASHLGKWSRVVRGLQ